jgi:hypothetical protein
MAERADVDVKALIAAQLRGEAPPAPGEELLGLRFVAWGDGESTWEMCCAVKHKASRGGVSP